MLAPAPPGSKPAAAMFAAAMARMRSVRRRRFRLLLGLAVTCEWARDHDTNENYLEAAEAMVRLAPENAAGAAYRGEARLRNPAIPQAPGKSSAGPTSLNPSTPFLPSIYLTSSFRTGKFAAAREVLDITQDSQSRASTLMLARSSSHCP